MVCRDGSKYEGQFDGIDCCYGKVILKLFCNYNFNEF